MSYIENMGINANLASKELNKLDTRTKNKILLEIADNLENKKELIKSENEKDLIAGREKGLTSAFLDRLTLNDSRIAGMVEGVRQIAKFADPIGEIEKGFRHENGMEIKKVRVPLGVIAMIYESRPNVTIDAAALCLKAGNSIILRGGTDAIYSNVVLANIIKEVLINNKLEFAVQLVEKPEREYINQLISLDKYIDVIIPRGGRGLKKAIMDNATIPVIETGAGLCHTYIDKFADLNKVKDIVVNAKVQRPGVCNAMETLLIHKDLLQEILPNLSKELRALKVELRACKECLPFVQDGILASDKDWDTEYLDLILSIKAVNSLDEAIEHINKYSTMHSEAIITESLENANIFTRDIDSACIYVNASTRFTDGGEFGFGGEIGISTQKLHARGPMGIRELTTLKYVIVGNGQIRG